MILASNLLPEEHKQVWNQARTRAHTGELHKTDITYTVGTRSVPDQDPEWDYNTRGNILARNWFITCHLIGLHKSALKAVNYTKIQKVIQERHENPSQLLNCLTKAFLQHTNLDTEDPNGKQLFITYFLSQSFPHSKAILKHLERGLNKQKISSGF